MGIRTEQPCGILPRKPGVQGTQNMTRRGPEVKPQWRSLPQEVRTHVEQALGGKVRRATRAWGGYGPTPAYRLLLDDGRRVFFKGTSAHSNTFAQDALLREERIYQEIPDLLGRWAPRLHTAITVQDWHILLIDDLGPPTVPPWSPTKTQAITHELAAFHQSTMDKPFPAWLTRPDEQLAQESWEKTAHASQEFQTIAALAGSQADEAQAWFHQLTPRIEQAMHTPALRTGPFALLHGDLRSDNLRCIQGHVYLFDWPAATIGRPEWDMVAFAQSIAVEAGPPPEQVLAWYAERFSFRARDLEEALVWWLTFFAERAWRAEIPGLPRLRRFQRQQLATMIAWLARHWLLPHPTWVEALLR